MRRHRPILALITTSAKIIFVGILGLLLWYQLRALDMDAVSHLIQGIGPPVLLLLLPYAAVILLDALGWRHTMPRPQSVSTTQLGLIRLATDAVMNTFPAGVAFAETLRPMLLQRRVGLRWSDAVSVTIVSKLNIAAMQMLFVLAGIVLAMIGYREQLRATAVFSSPAGAVLAAAAVMLVGGLLWLPYSGGRLSRLGMLLGRLPVPALKRGVAHLAWHLSEIDGYLLRFRQDRRSCLLRSLLYFLISWVLTAAQTWLIMDLLGAEITVVQAIIIESLAGVVKTVFFFLPSGIGAQDLSFIALLTSLGIPDAMPLSAAFILLRRGTEIIWALTGLAVFWHLGVNPLKPVLQSE